MDETKDEIEEALTLANQKILEKITEDRSLYGMGTTASLVKFWLGSKNQIKGVVGNVGDSRVYVIHADGSMEQVTIDDSETNLILHTRFRGDEQKIRETQSKFNNATDLKAFDADDQHLLTHRNTITNSIQGKSIEVRFYNIDLKTGDRILITSDGIHDNLTDAEIEDLLKKEKDCGIASDLLVEASVARSREGKKVNFRAKPDDMTAIVVEVSKIIEQGMPEPVPENLDSSVPLSNTILGDKLKSYGMTNESINKMTPEDALQFLWSKTNKVPELAPELEAKDRITLGIEDLKEMVVAQLGDKAEIEKMDVSLESGGLRLKVKLNAGLVGGRIFLDGLIVNNGNEINIIDLKVEARGFIKSRIEGNLSKFAPVVKKYFEDKYKVPVSRINIDGTSLIVELEGK